MNKLDMHIHTTASDGKLTPIEVVELAIKKNLKGIAITDHDTVNGIIEATEYNQNDIIIIPGIEFSCIKNNNEIHLLGYFIDYKNDNIINITNKIITHRKNRADKIIKKLNNIGVNIKVEDVLNESKGKSIGRPHIARVLINKNYVNSINEAFEKYLAKGRPAYVKRYKLSLQEGIDLIHNANGIAVIAHPGLLDNSINLKTLIHSYNIDGIEVYHSKHSENQEKQFYKIAINDNLIITGGSDYHGDRKEIAFDLGDKYIDVENIKELLFKYNYII